MNGRKRKRNRDWGRLPAATQQRIVEGIVAKKMSDPRRMAKVAAQRVELVAQRKEILGDGWRENCPFETTEGE